MDKAKFYMAISRFFGNSVVSWKCGVPNGQLIPGTQVADYRLLCISEFYGDEEVSVWISGLHNKVPNAEIRVGNIQQKPAEMSDLDYLITFPFSSFVLSFALDEAAADVKSRLAIAGANLNPQLITMIEGLIDGAIADYQYSK
ncbi:MAG: hypothetical protein IJ557_07630 [Bacteroidaceae bacterium]|nr:hypothetical protein [Bacteroidaceae bacterium]